MTTQVVTAKEMQAAEPMQLYDDFRGGLEKWTVLQVPLNQDSVWCHAEPEAEIVIAEGALTIRVPKFKRAHDSVQIFDNPKHLYLSTASFPLPRKGTAAFSVEMAAENIGGNLDDFRDGFAAFNVLDTSSGMVFDLVANSRHLYAIYERLYMPGIIPREDAFTWIVESPFAGWTTEPGQFHVYTIELDAEHTTADWYIDGKRVFHTEHFPVVPQEVKFGLGLITAHALSSGKSVSRRGQGMIGRWRAFRYRGVNSQLRKGANV